MFNLGEKVEVNLHNKSIRREGVIIEIKRHKGKIVYKVLFESDKVSLLSSSELIKCNLFLKR